MEHTRDEAGLGLALQCLQHALITAYENNCPVRLVKPARNSLRLTVRLESLRIKVRRHFNRGRSDQTPRSSELYREAQREYRRELRRASKETWRAFCTSINELHSAARLNRALSKDPKVRLGFLVTPTEERTQSEGEPSTFFCGGIFRAPGRRLWRPQPTIVALRDGIGGRRRESLPIEE
jgi:hypothetical protein